METEEGAGIAARKPTATDQKAKKAEINEKGRAEQPKKSYLAARKGHIWLRNCALVMAEHKPK